MLGARISNKNIIRFALGIAVLSWLAFVFSDIFILFGTVNKIKTGIPPAVTNIALDTFIISLFFYYKLRIGKVESINFIDLLWRVFATGLLATVVSLAIKFLFFAIGNTNFSENVFVINLSYHINFGLVSAFLISTFIVWKRLILYQKSKFLLKSWAIFEYLLLVSLLLDLFYFDFFNYLSIALLTILIIMGLAFSVNLKWVAYLNFKQKWKSILLILLVLLYLGYFIGNLWRFAVNNPITTNVLENTFIIAIFSFISLYALFSLLVILFNLPTSSVFEQKLEEVMNFQKLSQSIQTEKSEVQVYEILLQSATSTVFADAGWIEIFIEGKEGHYYSQNITDEEINVVKSHIKTDKIKGILDTDTDKNVKSDTQLNVLKGTRFKSIVAYPILVQNSQMGTLALLKEVSEGFNKEMTNIIRTFVNQAGISIENFRLMSEALENERYQEERKIAKQVSSSLLPKSLEFNEDFEIFSFSESADEVGGDYFDTCKIDDNKIAIVIADVSGKGTSAAFHMSQMKGVFNSLAQLGLGPKDFMINANRALSSSLEKTSFITASYFELDSNSKSVEFTRAGHCPTLYFNSSEKSSQFFEDKGLGLGIIRNSTYDNYIEVRKINYSQGDILLLYTDGITEAKNMKREEFGYERLKQIIENNYSKPADEIKNEVIDSLYGFLGKQLVDDDYTMLVIKFK